MDKHLISTHTKFKLVHLFLWLLALLLGLAIYIKQENPEERFEDPIIEHSEITE